MNRIQKALAPEKFVAWVKEVAASSPSTEYCYVDPNACLIARYLEAQGLLKGHNVGGNDIFDIKSDMPVCPIPWMVHDIACGLVNKVKRGYFKNQHRTYAGALARCKEMGLA